MNTENKNNLDHWLRDLNKRPIYNSLQIISKGNSLYVLKESIETYWLLIVPSKPVGENASTELVNKGFQEKHPKINYTKNISLKSEDVREQVKEEIEYIFHNILKVESDRQWRFEIQSGMKILKDPRPLLTKSELRHRNIKKLRTQYKWIDMDLLISLPIGVLLGVGLISEHKLIIFNKFLTVICSFLFLFIILKTISLLQKRSKSYILKRFFTHDKLDFFLIRGFERKGQRFTGKLKGFKTDIYFNTQGLTEVAVIHEEIPWEKLILLSKESKRIFNNNIIDLGQYTSKLKLKTRKSEKIFEETEKFIDKLIDQGFSPKK